MRDRLGRSFRLSSLFLGSGRILFIFPAMSLALCCRVLVFEDFDEVVVGFLWIFFDELAEFFG